MNPRIKTEVYPNDTPPNRIDIVYDSGKILEIKPDNVFAIFLGNIQLAEYLLEDTNKRLGNASDLELPEYAPYVIGDTYIYLTVIANGPLVLYRVDVEGPVFPIPVVPKDAEFKLINEPATITGHSSMNHGTTDGVSNTLQVLAMFCLFGAVGGLAGMFGKEGRKPMLYQ